MRNQHFDDRKMEVLMGRLLQFGVLLASTIVAIGGAAYVRDFSHSSVNYRTFVAHPIDILHPVAFLHRVEERDAAALILLGILILIGTPIARVVFAVIAFAMERDRLYILVSLLVLAVLLFGLLHGA
jgi:uncharacterized membrane protein